MRLNRYYSKFLCKPYSTLWSRADDSELVVFISFIARRTCSTARKTIQNYKKILASILCHKKFPLSQILSDLLIGTYCITVIVIKNRNKTLIKNFLIAIVTVDISKNLIVLLLSASRQQNASSCTFHLYISKKHFHCYITI